MTDQQPTYNELVQRITTLEQSISDIQPSQIDISRLTRKLEQSWTPDRTWISGTGVMPPLVTSLPSNPVDGQEIRFVADASLGVVWTLRYRASANTHKWEFIGGSPMYAESGMGSVTGTSSTSYQNVGPSLTFPLAGDYQLSYGATGLASPAAAVNCLFSPGYNGAPVDTDAVWICENSTISVTGAKSRKWNVVAGATVTGYMRSGNAAFTVYTQDRWISFIPIRVG